jgi:hypothetical protein
LCVTDDIPASNTILAVTTLHASRPRKDFTSPYHAALSNQFSVATFATLRVLNCLHSPGLHCSCYNVVRYCCDLEACNLVMEKVVITVPVAFTLLHTVPLESAVFKCQRTHCSKIYIRLT